MVCCHYRGSLLRGIGEWPLRSPGPFRLSVSRTPWGPGWQSGFQILLEALIAHLRTVNGGAHLHLEWNLQTIAAASASSLMVRGLRMPLSRVKKEGKSTGPSRPSAKVPTQTPSVSRYSSVRGISKKLLHPELITVTGVRPSSVRSAVTICQ